MTFILCSLDKSSQTRECFDYLFKFLTKIDAFYFLSDFLLAIVDFHVKRQIVLISWRRSQTTKLARVFDRRSVFFISERFNVTIENRSRYDHLDDWLQKFLYLINANVDFAIVIKDCSVSACFILFLILFKSMNFHVLRAIREKFDFVLQRIFVEMRMWSNNESRSKRVMQSFNLFAKWVVIKVWFMMLIELRIFHVIESFDKINVRLRFCIMLNKLFVATCCVELDESLQKNDKDWNLLITCDDRGTFRQWIA
jgi:hypothetical protein